MALTNPSETDPGVSRNSKTLSKELEGEEELEKLEIEVKQMAKKILDERATIPNLLTSTLSSLLAAQRPAIPDIANLRTDPGSSVPTTEAGMVQTEEERKIAEKVHLLKEKVSSNASALALVLERLRRCVSRTRELQSSNGITHPAFKKRKTS